MLCASSGRVAEESPEVDERHWVWYTDSGNEGVIGVISSGELETGEEYDKASIQGGTCCSKEVEEHERGKGSWTGTTLQLLWASSPNSMWDSPKELPNSISLI